MNGAFAVNVRGWSLCESPEATVHDLLGPSAYRMSLDSTTDSWRVEDPLRSEEPVGPVTSLVTFESDMQAEVRIVPGSHGQSAPADETGHEVVTLAIGDKSALVLDARCWYRINTAPALRVNLWLRQPVAIHS